MSEPPDDSLTERTERLVAEVRRLRDVVSRAQGVLHWHPERDGDSSARDVDLGEIAQAKTSKAYSILRDAGVPCHECPYERRP